MQATFGIIKSCKRRVRMAVCWREKRSCAKGVTGFWSTIFWRKRILMCKAGSGTVCYSQLCLLSTVDGDMPTNLSKKNKKKSQFRSLFYTK